MLILGWYPRGSHISCHTAICIRVLHLNLVRYFTPIVLCDNLFPLTVSSNVTDCHRCWYPHSLAASRQCQDSGCGDRWWQCRRRSGHERSVGACPVRRSVPPDSSTDVRTQVLLVWCAGVVCHVCDCGIRRHKHANVGTASVATAPNLSFTSQDANYAMESLTGAALACPPGTCVRARVRGGGPEMLGGICHSHSVSFGCESCRTDASV